MKHISIVIPVYNEQENVLLVAEAIKTTMAELPYTYNICFVDDGSKDHTLSVLRNFTDENIRYISFSKNFGKDAALKAGIDASLHADAVVTMDADLQHPPCLLKQMAALWENENIDVAYAYRKEQNKDAGKTHRLSSAIFYNLMNKLSDLDLEQGVSDYRWMDKKVAAVISKMNESEIFLRGLTKWVGFKQKGIEYTPPKRAYGAASYSKKKLIKLAMQGITSFSTRPLYAAAYLGFIISLLSVLYIPYALYSYFYGQAISGWTSVIVTIAFFGGLQLTILGIIGLYLGKLFMQSKERPLYIVKESTANATA
jgi:glycosyltransferase involved in cell wall biosynthesis